jgi:hypothetical protein
MSLRFLGTAGGRGLSAAVLFVAAATSTAWSAPTDPVNPLQKRFLKGKPLSICDQGSFFISGVPKVTNYATSTDGTAPHQIIIGQSYVQFQIPSKRRKWPIIMIHGSAHTGAALDATAHGKEGWLSLAVRNHLATFVMDQPGRGRSGSDASVINEAKALIEAGNVTEGLAMLPTIGGISASGAWTAWFGHILPTGSDILTGTMIRHGDPGDPDPPETDPPSEAHGRYLPRFPIPPVDRSIDPDIAARVGAIGPAPNPANNNYLALNYYKQLVPNFEALLPGSECPTCNPTMLAPSNTWSPKAMADLLERLGGGILAPHSQSVPQVLHTVRVLRERGKLHLLKGIIIPEGVTNFENTGTTPQDFDTIPFLIINGDYRGAEFARIGNRDFVAQLNASPTRSVGPATYIDLDDPRLRGKYLGTTHMMMVGTNAREVFKLALRWADRNIRNPIVTKSCPGGHGHDDDQGHHGHHGHHGKGR